MACVLVLIGLAGGLPAAAADPGRIVFKSMTGIEQIYVMNADGTGRTQLTFDTCHSERPAWSPGGSRIAFGHSYWSTPGMDGMEIYVMNADGTGQTRLTFNDLYDSQPAWSPDGSRIAFTSFRDGNDEVYVMNADGTGQARLTNNTYADDDSTWSPDGSRIAFTSFRPPVTEIYAMNADGTGQTRITSTGGEMPAWGSGAGIGPMPQVVRAPGAVGLPTDTDSDGRFDDTNGNDRQDFADVVLYFDQLNWIAANEPVVAFDYNANGRVDFADVVWLFDHL